MQQGGGISHDMLPVDCWGFSYAVLMEATVIVSMPGEVTKDICITLQSSWRPLSLTDIFCLCLPSLTSVACRHLSRGFCEHSRRMTAVRWDVISKGLSRHHIDATFGAIYRISIVVKAFRRAVSYVGADQKALLRGCSHRNPSPFAIWDSASYKSSYLAILVKNHCSIGANRQSPCMWCKGRWTE